MASSAPFQQDRTAYQDFQDRLSPTSLQGPVGTAFESAYGAMKDAQLARLVASVKAKFPGIAPADALAAIGADRGMPRGGTESDAAYAARLLNAWNIWPWAGTAYGLLQAFYSTGYQNVVLAQVRGGKQFTLDNGGMNLLRWSQTFKNAAWIANNCTVTADSAVAPDGTTTGTTLTDTATLTTHRVLQQTASTAASFGTASVYAKAGTVSFLAISDTGPSHVAVFDLSLGVVASTSGTGTSATITSVGGGWFRCTLTHPTLVVNDFFALNMGDTAAHALPSSSYSGGTGTVLVWGGQHEPSASATAYAATYNLAKTSALTAGSLLTAALPNALWETDPLSSYSPINQAFWSKFDVIFPLPLQAPSFSWSGGIPASNSVEANFIRALIQAWKPAHGTCNRIVIQQQGLVEGYPASLVLGANQGVLGATTTVWTP